MAVYPGPNPKMQMAKQEVACVFLCPGNYANTLLNESGSETISIFEYPWSLRIYIYEIEEPHPKRP